MAFQSSGIDVDDIYASDSANDNDNDEVTQLLPRPATSVPQSPNMAQDSNPIQISPTEGGNTAIKVDDISTHIVERSEEATQSEHSLTVTQALKLYRPSIFWALFFCIGQLMTAYDPQVLANLFAVPKFQRDFGYEFNRGYIVSAPWQTGLLMGGPIGQVAGSLFAGYPLEWYGRKKIFGLCVILTAGFVFNQFFASSLRALLVGELFGGLILGFYAVLTPTYASEVCPVVLRGLVTSNINLFIVVGQLLANGVVAGTQRYESHWAYSAPFATQWVWPVVTLLVLPFAPESKFLLSVFVGNSFSRLQVRGGSAARTNSTKQDDH